MEASSTEIQFSDQKKQKKLSKADWIALVVGVFIAQLIYKLGNFGFLPALIIAFGSFWLVKKMVLAFSKKKNPTKPPINTETPHTQKKKTKKILIIALVLIVIGALYILFNSISSDLLIGKTDKSPQNSIIEDNLYRNTKYNFRIKFPVGWEIKQGDGPSIVQKAVKGDNSISIGVRPMRVGKDLVITDVMDLEDFKNTSLESEQYNGIEVLDYGETKLDNVSAYWITYSTTYSALDVTVHAVITQYGVLKSGNYFFISIGSTTQEYPSIERIFKQSVSTFVFENYQ